MCAIMSRTSIKSSSTYTRSWRVKKEKGENTYQCGRTATLPPKIIEISSWK